LCESGPQLYVAAAALRASCTWRRWPVGRGTGAQRLPVVPLSRQLICFIQEIELISSKIFISAETSLAHLSIEYSVFVCCKPATANIGCFSVVEEERKLALDRHVKSLHLKRRGSLHWQGKIQRTNFPALPGQVIFFRLLKWSSS